MVVIPAKVYSTTTVDEEIREFTVQQSMTNKQYGPNSGPMCENDQDHAKSQRNALRNGNSWLITPANGYAIIFDRRWGYTRYIFTIRSVTMPSLVTVTS